MSPFRLVLAGASIGNGNRGVDALGTGVLDAAAAFPGTRVSVLDDGWGVRQEAGERYPGLVVERVGVRNSRRWHRPESWAHVAAAQRVAPRANPAARRIAEADAVLDLSAGDSFTDIYGPTRLQTVCAPKQAALRASRPLVLLPQTYGPFRTAEGRATAQRLVRASCLAYARDPWSYGQLLDLAGPHADASRLREGVDVAFALVPHAPPAPVAEALAAHGSGEVLAGVNISGLLRDPSRAARFGLAGDYLGTLTALVRALIAAGAFVVLVPHVHLPGGAGESDAAAITATLGRLAPAERARTMVLPPDLDAAQLKWSIARLDWFAGSRMHATIAALSSGVPTFGYAYSDKMVGVFDTCHLAGHVADARRVAGPAAVELMLESFERRQTTGRDLGAAVPEVVARARDQLTDLLAELAGVLPAGGVG